MLKNTEFFGMIQSALSWSTVDSEGIIRKVPRMTIRSDFRMLPETIKALQDALNP